MAAASTDRQGADALAAEAQLEQTSTDIAPQSAPVAEEFARTQAAESIAELVLVEYKEDTLHALESLCFFIFFDDHRCTHSKRTTHRV